MARTTSQPSGRQRTVSQPIPLPETAGASTVSLAALAGIAAAWIAAGSTGLMGHPLRHTLAAVALGAAAVLGWPRPAIRGLVWLIPGITLSAALVISTDRAVNVLAAAVLLATLAAAWPASQRAPLVASAMGVLVFALWRIVAFSAGWVWLAADGVAGGIARLVGGLTGHSLWVGPTFGGADFLITMAAMYGLWLWHTPAPRLTRAVWAAVGIAAAHVLYLALLSLVPSLISGFPPPQLEPPPGTPIGQVPWVWTDAARKLLPWQLPALGAALQLVVLGVMFRWSDWRTPSPRPIPISWLNGRTLLPGSAAVAGVLAVVCTLHPQRLSLEGKKIVFYEKGFLNWLKPEHGQYGRLSIGMYGMMPTFIESYGGQCLISKELSQEDLAGAHALVLLFPNEPWTPDQKQRIHTFVQNGGSMLVFGEHTIDDKGVPPGMGGNRFNEILHPTAIQVAFDSGTFEIGGWLHSYDAMYHPTSTAISDENNGFGAVIGASLDIRWPASPLLVGRWGWGDPGDVGSAAAMMGDHAYGAGERLGDLVLAAEQRFGKGKVIVFGDTSTMTNGITIGAYPYSSRLLAYAAGGGSGPQAGWRQVLAILLAVVVVAGVVGTVSPHATAVVAVALALTVLATSWVSERRATLYPDGRLKTPNNLAYIDSCHLGAYSEESLRPEGVMGLELTLLRNGFLTLRAPDLSWERLRRAGLLITIAPGKPYSAREIRNVRRFIEDGGIFICTVGFEHREGSRDMLRAFGFHVGGRNADTHEPEPLSFFKSPYVDTGDYMAHVRFWSGWPVECDAPDARPIAYGRGNVPVILMRQIGKGKMVVIGDSHFATNKNTENVDGSPIEGMRENSDFWRWLLADLRGTQRWLPSRPAAQPPSPAAPEAPQNEADEEGEQ